MHVNELESFIPFYNEDMHIKTLSIIWYTSSLIVFTYFITLSSSYLSYFQTREKNISYTVQFKVIAIADDVDN